MILYTENPKGATRKLLQFINEFSKVADTKLIHRNLLHFYTLNDRRSQGEIKETIPFTMASK